MLHLSMLMIHFFCLNPAFRANRVPSVPSYFGPVAPRPHGPWLARNQYLVWAHMQRRHDQMSPELKNDLNELLRHSMKVSQATRLRRSGTSHGNKNP